MLCCCDKGSIISTILVVLIYGVLLRPVVRGRSVSLSTNIIRRFQFCIYVKFVAEGTSVTGTAREVACIDIVAIAALVEDLCTLGLGANAIELEIGCSVIELELVCVHILFWVSSAMWWPGFPRRGLGVPQVSKVITLIHKRHEGLTSVIRFALGRVRLMTFDISVEKFFYVAVIIQLHLLFQRSWS